MSFPRNQHTVLVDIDCSTCLISRSHNSRFDIVSLNPNNIGSVAFTRRLDQNAQGPPHIVEYSIGLTLRRIWVNFWAVILPHDTRKSSQLVYSLCNPRVYAIYPCKAFSPARVYSWSHVIRYQTPTQLHHGSPKHGTVDTSIQILQLTEESHVRG